MPTHHDETLLERYQREHREFDGMNMSKAEELSRELCSYVRTEKTAPDALLAGTASELRRLSAINAELLAALKQCLGMLEHADFSTGYCCCGSPMDDHGIGDGHGPVDQGDYYQCSAMDAARAAIAKAQGEQT